LLLLLLLFSNQITSPADRPFIHQLALIPATYFDVKNFRKQYIFCIL